MSFPVFQNHNEAINHMINHWGTDHRKIIAITSQLGSKTVEIQVFTPEMLRKKATLKKIVEHFNAGQLGYMENGVLHCKTSTSHDLKSRQVQQVTLKNSTQHTSTSIEIQALEDEEFNALMATLNDLYEKSLLEMNNKPVIEGTQLTVAVIQKTKSNVMSETATPGHALHKAAKQSLSQRTSSQAEQDRRNADETYKKEREEVKEEIREVRERVYLTKEQDKWDLRQESVKKMMS